MTACTFSLLLLCGMALGPLAEAALFVDTRPELWAEPGSLQEPWAQLELLCRAREPSGSFQLFKDGSAQEPVRLDVPALERRFPLGAVTAATRGLYRCRCRLSDHWSELSDLVEVSGPGSLPPPSLEATPVPWTTPGLQVSLRCRAAFRGVTFQLRREGDAAPQAAQKPDGREAVFPGAQAGNYSCSYRTHAAGAPSAPSATVLVRELAKPPAPTLSLGWQESALRRPGEATTLVCAAPLDAGVDFQLRRGDEELRLPMSSTAPDRVFLRLADLAPSAGGAYTCRYRLREAQGWSEDSEAQELRLNDETLPAPELLAEPATSSPQPGTRVQLRCRAPRAGLRFALLYQEGNSHTQVLRFLSPEGSEALFELREVSVADSGNYSCVYLDTNAPFSGSKPSAPLELRVDGPAPKPRLSALWTGPVSPGHDAVLRCESPVAKVYFQLLRAGDEKPFLQRWSDQPSLDFKLSYVGPQHAGIYSCKYKPRGPSPVLSEPSDPVELKVAVS
ncbi:alpha-1B-glycoprotein [Suncus etruscus]|uniref:alpha-1B-glycoprotein n=1 Tax=Suncus etruscus TaxID=109475 RepID=UPI00210FCEA0|nr:alpha-1B-glycoprotein [Suncus etruscus]